jgi:hypothetical protein
MNNREWRTIPVLRYTAIDETLTFWETLGFKITYRQDRPYKYAIVERAGYQLHFVYTKGAEVSQAYYGCLITVSDVQIVYRELSGNLKSRLGKIPSSGLPRISRMKPTQTRFTITDPSGNSVILIQYGGTDQASYEAADKKDLSELGKSIALAIRLRDFKEDYLAAAKTLDIALKKQPHSHKNEMAEALIIRAELARILNEQMREKQCNDQLAHMEISDREIIKLKLKHRWTS